MKGHRPDSFRCETQISAVILDLDGTLLNTEKATETVLKDFLAQYGRELDSGKEESRFGKTQKESAASIVKDYNLQMTGDEFTNEIMPWYKARWPETKALPGANRLIIHLHKHGIPFALASNSIRKHIEEKISYHTGWRESFSVILGSDEVNSGKPSPDIFLEAAKRMHVDPTHCLVIEDSLVGIQAAKAAGMKVVAVPSLVTQAGHYSIANCVLHSLLEFQPEMWGLPKFEDWVQDALPVEPMCIEVVLNKVPPDNSMPHIIISGQTSSVSLPDQVSGVYFGWLGVRTNEIFKVVVSIGWDLSTGIAKRLIQPFLVGEFDEANPSGFNEDIRGKLLQLWIVGYIRQLHNEAYVSAACEIFPEDRNIAEAALDLPMFSHPLAEASLSECSTSNEHHIFHYSTCMNGVANQGCV